MSYGGYSTYDILWVCHWALLIKQLWYGMLFRKNGDMFSWMEDVFIKMGGHLTLPKSVLSSLPMYFLPI